MADQEPSPVQQDAPAPSSTSLPTTAEQLQLSHATTGTSEPQVQPTASPAPAVGSSSSDAVPAGLATPQPRRAPALDLESESAFPSLAASVSSPPTWGKGKGKKPVNGQGPAVSGAASGWSTGQTAAQKLAQQHAGGGTAAGGLSVVAGETPKRADTPFPPVPASSANPAPTPVRSLPQPAISGQALPTVSVLSTTFALPTASINLSAPRPPPGPKPYSARFAPAQGPLTMKDVLNGVMKANEGVRIEASNSKTTTTFLIKAKVEAPAGKSKVSPQEYTQAKLDKAKRDLAQRVTRKETIIVQIPSSIRPFIIGTKGRNLKAITDATGTSITFPKREGEEGAPAPAAEEPVASDENADDPLVPVTIAGDSASVQEAKARIMAVVNERTSKISQKISAIPREFYPLLNGVKGKKMAELVKVTLRGDATDPTEHGAVDDLSVFVPSHFVDRNRGIAANGVGHEDEESGAGGDPKAAQKGKERDGSIVVSGDREAVAKVVEAIENSYDELKRLTQTLSINIPKRQHRFLVGQNADDILEATGCAVELVPADDPSEAVTIRGKSVDLPKALASVMEKANATSIDTIDLSKAHRGSFDAIQYAKDLTRYFIRRGKLRPITEQHNVQIFLPRVTSIEAGNSNVEIVGKVAGDVQAARTAASNLVKTLPPASFATVEIDYLVHKHLIGKKASKVKALEEKKSVEIVFPGESEQRSDVLLVLVGSAGGAAADGTALDDVKAELLQAAKEAADIKTVTLNIASKLHRYIIGQGGTTLNAVIGEEKAVSVRLGPQANRTGESDVQTSAAKGDVGEDQIVIRGPSEEVARVEKEILRIAEEAKDTEKINSYTAEFDVDAKHVSHIVGKGGASISKLRDELGVRIDFGEPGTDPKGRKGAKSHVVIKGRKENVEEAKKRITGQSDRIADEVSITVPMPADLDKGVLIGKQGVYVQRLENNYGVRINFPKSGNADDDAASEAGVADAIRIRGPTKGVQAAKKELVDLIAFEKENSASASFTVSAKALPRIMGRSGSQIREIQDETGAAIDVETVDEATRRITVRGTKEAVAGAKKLINAIAKEIDDEDVATLSIERSFHVTLIGKGGANIRDIVQRCGGPTEAAAQGRLVRFSRAGEPADVVTLRGPKDLVSKVKAEIEKEVSNLQGRSVVGVRVPRSSHATIIGRGGAALQDLQRKHDVKVVMPNWKEYGQVGEPSNAAELEGVPAEDLVKVLGAPSACQAAIADLKSRGQPQQTLSKTVLVPYRLHGSIAQGGRFFKNLPPGSRIEHGDAKVPKGLPRRPQRATNGNGNGNGPSQARIDQDEEEADGGDFHWEVLPLHTEDDGEEADIPWIITSNNQAILDKAEKLVSDALEDSRNETHIGYLTVPPSSMGRIVGRGGSGLERIRAIGVKVDILGRRDSDTLTIVGLPDKLEAARTAVIELAESAPRRQNR